MSQPDWTDQVAGLVASQVRVYRERRNMSAQQLADACTEAGLPIKRSVIANWENGRRTTVSVAELLVLGSVLGIPPILLLFPIGQHESVEVVPGKKMSPWAAAKWFSGVEPAGIETGLPVKVDLQAWRPITLYMQHDDLVRKLRGEAQRTRLITDADRRRDVERNIRNLEEALGDVRNEIRKFGIVLPDLPEELTYIDALGKE